MSNEEAVEQQALRDYTFLVWDDREVRRGRPPSLAERLAPARERFEEKFGQPPTLVLLPVAEEPADLDLPVRVYPATGTGHLWLGAMLREPGTTPEPAVAPRRNRARQAATPNATPVASTGTLVTAEARPPRPRRAPDQPPAPARRGRTAPARALAVSPTTLPSMVTPDRAPEPARAASSPTSRPRPARQRRPAGPAPATAVAPPAMPQPAVRAPRRTRAAEGATKAGPARRTAAAPTTRTQQRRSGRAAAGQPGQ